mgnify:CR=1
MRRAREHYLCKVTRAALKRLYLVENNNFFVCFIQLYNKTIKVILDDKCMMNHLFVLVLVLLLKRWHDRLLIFVVFVVQIRFDGDPVTGG